MKRTRQGITLFLLTAISISTFADQANTNDPCGGPNALLSIVDRPTTADSPCTMPQKHLGIEGGAQYQMLQQQGYQQNLPTAELRIGLSKKNELAFVFPNYIHQTVTPRAGWTTASIFLKHELFYAPNWIISIEGGIILPYGSANFGDDKTGGTLNGIFSYNINTKFSLSGMLGLTTQTGPHNQGGKRFTSLNPDLVLSYLPTEWTELFIEAFGETKTAANQTSGYGSDAGILYLIEPYFVIDAEVEQNLSGSIGGYQRYVGAGLAIMI